jgi:hypothetical protein
MANPEGGGDEGPSVPGAGVIVHHLGPTGPGVDGLTSEGDGDGGLSGIGSKVIQLAPTPDPENNPRAMKGLREATIAQSALLAETVAVRLGGSLVAGGE